jgi:tetratricopeptide (TPR) repeat protein
MEAAVGLSDYLLLLDADMILQIGKNFNKNNLLLCDAATLFQGTDEFYYHNLRICKNEGKCKYIGVTHEYMSLPNEYLKRTNISREELFILDIGDGGSKSNKYERDIALLEQGIKDEPNNERYYFYLGNSYHDSGKYNEAIPIYKKRIELGGWNEEVWYSYYRLGFCYYNLKQYNEAIGNWLEGYNFYPARIENIYEILKYYRVNSKYNNAKNAAYVYDGYKEFYLNDKCCGIDDDFTKGSWRRFVKIQAFL